MFYMHKNGDMRIAYTCSPAVVDLPAGMTIQLEARSHVAEWDSSRPVIVPLCKNPRSCTRVIPHQYCVRTGGR